MSYWETLDSALHVDTNGRKPSAQTCSQMKLCFGGLSGSMNIRVNTLHFTPLEHCTVAMTDIIHLINL